MAVADRLLKIAEEYTQRSAHHVEKAELGRADAIDERLTAIIYTGIAITLREVAIAIEKENAEDLAA